MSRGDNVMSYQSTRSAAAANSLEAVLTGIAPDGGLYIDPSIAARPFDWRKCLSLDELGMAEMLLGFLLPEFEDMGALVRRAGSVWLAAVPCAEDAAIDRPLPYLLVPFMVLAIYLVGSHTLQNVNGALYTGQCTYGDMAMHLSFITSIAEQQTFPPEYNLLPGTPVSYPFLCDSVSSSLNLLGTPLRWAYMIPMFFAFAQVFCGVWFLSREFCRKKYAPVLAFLLFFLNGGLGMIYFLNGEYSLRDLFTAFYKTPTNLTEKGMRWVNVIADMLLPQRATLFGWAALFAVLYLLFRAVFRGDTRLYLPAGILGGLLPMVHTHSYFALGLMAACWLVYSAVRDRLSREWFLRWLQYGLPAVLLALCMAAVPVILVVFTVRAAGYARSAFYTIASSAAAAMLITQTLLNVLGSVDLLPLTGVTFPFVSMGGSSMLACWGLLAYLKAADTRRNASFTLRLPKWSSRAADMAAEEDEEEDEEDEDE